MEAPFGERRRYAAPPNPTVALVKGLSRTRWFPRPAASEPEKTVETPASLNPEEMRRASLVARMASRLMAGILSNPSRQAPTEQSVKSVVQMATQIEREARRAVVAPAGEATLPPSTALPGPSPHATAWQAGYRDGEAGRSPAFRGPKELEADYWAGLDVARMDGERRAAND